MERCCMQMVSMCACMRVQWVGVWVGMQMGCAAGWYVRADTACGCVACVCGYGWGTWMH